MISRRLRLPALLLPISLGLAAALGVFLGGRSGVMLSGFSLSVLVLGALGLWLTYSAVAVQRRVPLRCDAGKQLEALVQVRLRYPLPWLLIEARDHSPQLLAGQEPVLSEGPLWLRQSLDLRWSAVPRRGMHVLPPALVTLRDPFSIFERTLLTVPLEIEAWPSRTRLPERFLGRSGGALDELQGTRPFSGGDSPRHIVWNRFARDGRLEVRRFAARPEGPLLVVLDPAPGPHFEALVSAAASVIETSLRQSRPVGLHVLGGPDLPPAAGEDHLVRLMQALTRLSPIKEAPELDAPPEALLLRPDPNDPDAALLELHGRSFPFHSLEELKERLRRMGGA